MQWRVRVFPRTPLPLRHPGERRDRASKSPPQGGFFRYRPQQITRYRIRRTKKTLVLTRCSVPVIEADTKTDTRLNMRARISILLTLLCAFPFATHAVDIGGRVGTELSCGDAERRLVGVLNDKRGQGVAKETLLAKMANFADEERLIAEYRIEDVYLDPALTLPTIVAYRMERCLRRFERRNYLPYKDLVRERLLRCQNENAYGSRRFARCIDDLLHALEDQVNTSVETP
jgi:hypothetical protein